jgi:hypothetical protein
MKRWTWTERGEPPRNYIELSRDGQAVGELQFIITPARPATIAVGLCALLDDIDAEIEAQAAEDYHARRADLRDDQPESIVNQ